VCNRRLQSGAIERGRLSPSLLPRLHPNRGDGRGAGSLCRRRPLRRPCRLNESGLRIHGVSRPRPSRKETSRRPNTVGARSTWQRIRSLRSPSIDGLRRWSGP